MILWSEENFLRFLILCKESVKEIRYLSTEEIWFVWIILRNLRESLVFIEFIFRVKKSVKKWTFKRGKEMIKVWPRASCEPASSWWSRDLSRRWDKQTRNMNACWGNFFLIFFPFYKADKSWFCHTIKILEWNTMETAVLVDKVRHLLLLMRLQ